MKLTIDTEDILKKINLEKVIADKIADESEIDVLVSEIIEDKEVSKLLKHKIFDCITEYLNTKEGKKLIIDKFNDYIGDMDLSDFEELNSIINTFIKDSLIISKK